jgi:hypothetical protein
MIMVDLPSFWSHQAQLGLFVQARGLLLAKEPLHLHAKEIPGEVRRVDEC